MWALTHMDLIVGDASATNQIDDHADDRFDIRIRARVCTHVVLVVSLRLAI